MLASQGYNAHAHPAFRRFGLVFLHETKPFVAPVAPGIMCGEKETGRQGASLGLTAI